MIRTLKAFPSFLLFLLFLALAPSLSAQSISKTPITTIAFGSCSNQLKPQPMLRVARKQNPDLFIYLGDNIYADTRDMAVLKRKYRTLGRKPNFKKLRKSTSVLATWDDHDYGENDAGRHYPFKRESKEIFLDFWKEPLNSTRRLHPGVYHSVLLGPPGKRVQVILLDTRTFRDDLLLNNDSTKWKNDYRPNPSPDSTFLGEAQWEWLERQFQVPAQVRIIASSNQFAHAYNGWESWNNVPKEQERMLNLIAKTMANGIIFISGDVHWGEISLREPRQTYPIFDVTSSGITQTWHSTEPNEYRVGEVVPEVNIGLMEINWDLKVPQITLKLIDKKQEIRAEVSVPIRDLYFKD